MVVEGKTIDECVTKASAELGIEKSKVKYKVLGMDKSGEELKISVEILNECDICEIIDISNEDLEEVNVIAEDNIEVKVNGKIKNGEFKINKNDIVKAKIISNEKDIKIIVRVSKDKLEAVLEVEQGDIRKKVLDKKIKDNTLYLSIKYDGYKEIDLNMKKEEILKGIKIKNINFGLDFEKINNVILSKDEVAQEVIAKGIPSIDDEEDIIELLYKKKEDESNINYKIDYKNTRKIDNVLAGTELALIHRGAIGKDGTDVFGETIKKRNKKDIPIKLGEGVELREDLIIALKDGRVELKNGFIKVIDIIDITGDIDIEKGNVNFIGDINIVGNVNMGMTVSGGNLINIDKNVESAIIKSGGDSIIKGSVLNSKVIAGVENEDFLKYIDCLKSLESDIVSIKNIAKQLKDSKEMNFSDGKIVKFVIDQKFGSLQKKVFQVLAYKVAYKSFFDNEEGLIEILRNRLAGLGPLNIKNLNEIDHILKVIKNEIDKVNKTMLKLSNIFIAYCQDSTITASGDVIFTGKGQYVSEVNAGRDVIFEGEIGVSRGGVIRANRNIKAKIVGSPAGVTTVLSVMDKGKIEIEEYYHNTTVKIGNRKCILDTKGKNLLAYLDKDGELIVEKMNA